MHRPKRYVPSRRMNQALWVQHLTMGTFVWLHLVEAGTNLSPTVQCIQPQAVSITVAWDLKGVLTQVLLASFMRGSGVHTDTFPGY